MPEQATQYVVTDSSVLEVQDVYRLGGEEGGDECVICFSEPTSVTLLPCRHECVCDECFRQVDKCPVCRATFATYIQAAPRCRAQNAA